MTPLQVAAKFAAFVWYTHSREASDQTIQREARQFAKENWQVFLPVAHEGLGQLLIRVSKRRQLHELPRRNSATQNACWLRPVECTIRRQSTVRHSSLAHFPAKRATKARFRRFSQPLQVRRTACKPRAACGSKEVRYGLFASTGFSPAIYQGGERTMAAKWVLPIIVGYPTNSAAPANKRDPEILCWK